MKNLLELTQSGDQSWLNFIRPHHHYS